MTYVNETERTNMSKMSHIQNLNENYERDTDKTSVVDGDQYENNSAIISGKKQFVDIDDPYQ